MANSKISALTSATTPLAGTETLPIVQSSATVKVATNDLTVRNVRANATTGILQVTGPANASTRVMTTPDANFTVARTDAAQSFTGNQTLSTGNLVIGTSGKGIDFSVTPDGSGTMTSELFNDYEEGVWTAADATGTGVIITNNSTAKYTKIGRLVIASCNITIGVTASATTAQITMPFAANVDSGASSQGGVVIESTYNVTSLAAAVDTTTGTRFRPDGGAGLSYAVLSGKNLRYTIFYVGS